MEEEAGGLVFSKSLALIERTRSQMMRVDGANFPTSSSESARTLVLRALEALSKAENWPPMERGVLYNALIRLQSLAAEIEASTSEHISWPLVGYCDQVWNLLFEDRSVRLFYSVTTEHNYTVSSFSSRLHELLKPLLTKAELSRVLAEDKIYCLQLASLEDENLPLYANIAHEFGHVLFQTHQADIERNLADVSTQFFKRAASFFFASDKSSHLALNLRTRLIVSKLATELFCDLVGSIVAGPAFLLSLREMAWGGPQNNWRIVSPKLSSATIAYPSSRFRFQLVKQWVAISKFTADASRFFPKLRTSELQGVLTSVNAIQSDHSGDVIRLTSASEAERRWILPFLTDHLLEMKGVLETFLERCRENVLKEYICMKQFSPVVGEDVFELMRRFEHNIMPNIIPNGELLGRPAPFSAILNASALYRLSLLSKTEPINTVNVHKEIQKIERLTAKAMEVSYIQQEFIQSSMSGHEHS